MLPDLDGFDPENVTGKYVLDDEGEPVAEPNLLKWAMWMETREHVVLQTRVSRAARVSTIFLGLNYDHFSFNDSSRPPILWETMVFGPRSAFDGLCRRYTSKLDALAGHANVCEMVERFDAPRMPRRLKKALRKVADERPLRPGDKRRLWRWHTQVGAFVGARHW